MAGIKQNRSPIMSLLWSMAIPGFGQLYNGDYLIGLTLISLEFLINVKANLNLAILYSLRGQLSDANYIANFQWLLFYPCVYAFSLWQAYNQARENQTGIVTTQGNGLFIGFAMVGTLGVIFCYGLGPVWGGLLGCLGGSAIGWLAERLIRGYNGNAKP